VTRPLSDIRVLDSGQCIAGLLVGMTSADPETASLQIAVDCKNARISAPTHAPKYGKDTLEVLKTLKSSKQEIARMIAQSDAATGWGERYLPE